MPDTIIKQGYKLELGRKRTRVTTYENLRLNTRTQPQKEKSEETKPRLPSAYADHNYYKRMHQRKEKIKELAYNSFEYKSAVMITLTFDTPTRELQQAHKKFKQFIQRVNSHYDGFRYLATFSKQKNGSWHYHVLCNFKPTTRNATIMELWKNGITYITVLDKSAMFDTAIKYLIDNMEEAAGDIKGKHGYLASDNLEKNIILTSYKAEHEQEFDEAFQRVLENPRGILYYTKNHLGIQGETVDPETGEFITYTIPNQQLNPHLEKAGFSTWESVFHHLSSSARFDEKFSVLQTAVPKQKKLKKAKSKKSTDISDQPVKEL